MFLEMYRWTESLAQAIIGCVGELHPSLKNVGVSLQKITCSILTIVPSLNKISQSVTVIFFSLNGQIILSTYSKDIGKFRLPQHLRQSRF